MKVLSQMGRQSIEKLSVVLFQVNMGPARTAKRRTKVVPLCVIFGFSRDLADLLYVCKIIRGAW